MPVAPRCRDRVVAEPRERLRQEVHDERTLGQRLLVVLGHEVLEQDVEARSAHELVVAGTAGEPVVVTDAVEVVVAPGAEQDLEHVGVGAGDRVVVVAADVPLEPREGVVAEPRRGSRGRIDHDAARSIEVDQLVRVGLGLPPVPSALSFPAPG